MKAKEPAIPGSEQGGTPGRRLGRFRLYYNLRLRPGGVDKGNTTAPPSASNVDVFYLSGFWLGRRTVPAGLSGVGNRLPRYVWSHVKCGCVKRGAVPLSTWRASVSEAEAAFPLKLPPGTGIIIAP